MTWRVRFEIQGGHVHCHLFCARQVNMTFAKCGDFVVRRGEEFASLVRAFGGADFIGSGKNGIIEASREEAA